MHEFNQSLKYDQRMYAADVKGSIAFSKALLKAGIVDEKEQAEISRGLKLVEQEWEKGEVSSRCLISLSTCFVLPMFPDFGSNHFGFGIKRPALKLLVQDSTRR